nr:amino acid adenylation domain-containing protein [Pirellula sp.]
MDQETSNGFPTLEPLAHSGQDGAFGDLAFSSDPTRDRFEFSVPYWIVEQLEKTSRLDGLDVSSVLLSAFAWVLHRYTGGLLDDWIRADAPQKFGDLARHFSNDPSFSFNGEYFSTQFSVHDFPSDFGASTIPECRISFVYDPWGTQAPQANAQGQNASWEHSREAHDATPDFSLRLFAERKSESTPQVKGSLVYRTQWWRHDRIERFVGHFQKLLSQATTDPDIVLAKLPILTMREQRQLLVEFNDTACEYPRELCVHELFEQQVERTPDAVALVFEDQQLSYNELNARANRLARYLRKHGVGEETPVGLCLERSLDLVVSILGILKAGGTYVPLDADYPVKRLENMLELAEVKHLVTQSQLDAKLPSTKRLDICIDRDANEIASEDSSNLDLAYNSNRLAYIIFTSGSTGQPKGVMIEHRSLVNLLADMASRLNFTQGDSLLSVSTPCFDISLLEILLPLAAAGLVEVASRDAFSDVRVLINRLESKRFTWLFSTPSRLDLLLHGGWQGDPALNVLTGGEQLSQSLSVQLATRCCSLWNLYGPTEATILSTAIEAIDQNPGCCIGRPVSNTQVYVLDSHRELLPIGVPGELYIGGDGLARGYLNRPDLTAERFVPNPFSKDSDSKLYRTGDLCRWKHDGTLEYLGRIDHQVKLRGFRIELGEIESVLSQHPSIAQCVVVLREDRPGDKRLVAYYTQCGEQHPSILELRESLGSKLPEYMVPAAFVR